MTPPMNYEHVDPNVGSLERKRRHARARSADAVRRSLRARRSVVG